MDMGKLPDQQVEALDFGKTAGGKDDLFPGPCKRVGRIMLQKVGDIDQFCMAVMPLHQFRRFRHQLGRQQGQHIDAAVLLLKAPNVLLFKAVVMVQLADFQHAVGTVF